MPHTTPEKKQLFFFLRGIQTSDSLLIYALVQLELFLVRFSQSWLFIFYHFDRVSSYFWLNSVIFGHISCSDCLFFYSFLLRFSCSSFVSVWSWLILVKSSWIVIIFGLFFNVGCSLVQACYLFLEVHLFGAIHQYWAVVRYRAVASIELFLKFFVFRHL